MSRPKKKKQAPKKERRAKGEIYQPSLFEKRRGAQPGNQNAVKHGLYSSRFAPDEIENLAGMRDGLKDEIDLVRVTLARIADYMQSAQPETIADYVALQNLVSKHAATISRLMQVDKALNDAENTSVGEKLLAALQDVTAELAEKD